MSSWASIGLSAILLVLSVGATRERHVQGLTLISESSPKTRLIVSPGFNYEGRLAYTLDGFEGERFVFVDAKRATLRRLLIVQFEQVAASSSEIYRYDLRAGREMGGLRFVANTFAFPGARQVVTSPKDEADRTNNFLLTRGFKMPKVWLAARHVTIGDGDRRRCEMIVFYMEARSDLAIADLYSDDEPTPAWQRLKPGVEERSRASFIIE